jgi:hypothetical protein
LELAVSSGLSLVLHPAEATTTASSKAENAIEGNLRIVSMNRAIGVPHDDTPEKRALRAAGGA